MIKSDQKVLVFHNDTWQDSFTDSILISIDYLIKYEDKMSIDLIKRELNISQEKKLDIVACLKVLAEHLDSDDQWVYAGKVFSVELAKFRKIQRLQRTLFDIETDDRTPDLSEVMGARN